MSADSYGYSDYPVHPGVLLGEELEVRGMSPRTMAEAMGRPVPFVEQIIRGARDVTAEIAWELEDALGIPAHFWMNIQTRYDLTLARNARLGRGTG